jgi:NodT family efflux transporter outer membrane factor (OMF) lipoprotein
MASDRARSRPRSHTTVYKRTLALSGSLALMAGCAHLPAKPEAYVTPAATATLPREDFVNQTQFGADAVPTDTAFWAGFGDPQLSAAIANATGSNLDIAIAQARLRQAGAGVALSGALRLPSGITSISLGQSQASREGTQSATLQLPGAKRTNSLFDFGVAASWEIDLSGGRAASQNSAFSRFQASEAALAGAAITIAAETARAYIALRTSQQRLALLTEQIALETQLRDLMMRRNARGSENELAVRLADGRIASAAAQRPGLHTTIEVNLNRLDVLQGAQPGAHRAMFNAVKPIPRAPDLRPAMSPQDLLTRRPDIIAAERRVAAARSDLTAVIADYYPKVSLDGLAGLQSLDAGKLLTPDAAQLSGLIGLRWRLFDFGKLDAAREKATAAEDEALLTYRQTAILAAEDVENALVLRASLKNQSASVSQALGAAQRAATIAEQGWTAGATSLIPVLNARIAVLDLKGQMAELDGAQAQAAIILYRAIGGGWTASFTPFSIPKNGERP